METSICGNCMNNKHCIYQLNEQNGFRTHCDSYEWDLTETRPFAKTTTTTNSNEVLGAIGLCSSCDSKNYCSLRGPKQIILQCEHYV